MKQAKHAAETQTFTKAIHTPIGILILKERDGAICAIDLARESDERPADSAVTPVLEQAAREIADSYVALRYGVRGDMDAFNRLVGEFIGRKM